MTFKTTRPGRIVVGVDSSDNAARAATWAAGEAAERGLRLHLVHALDLPPSLGPLLDGPAYERAQRATGQELLDRLSTRLQEQRPDLVVETEVSTLDPAGTLVNLSYRAQLVVTGTRGHGGFAGLLLGSVSLKVAAHAHCPTVVVRGSDTYEPLDEIVLGLEPDQAEAPIRFAFDTAAEVGATVSAVRAWSPSAAYAGYYVADAIEGRENAETAEVAELMKAVREDYPQVEVSTHVMLGNPVSALIAAALNSRMLVIGAHRHRGPLSVGAGYVVQGLLAHSPTPVAVVPIT
ncbi:MAG TPA: universal stress protein [Actinocrinis sp.]|nr:universal stress protein [Actinocrinis sp.]